MRVHVLVLSAVLSTPSFASADADPIETGIAAAWRGDSGAEAILRTGLAACGEALDSDAAMRCASGMNVLAALLHASGRLAEADGLFRRAMSRLDIRRPGHAGVLADAANGLAGLLADRGDWREADQLASRARDLWEKSCGRECPDLARALMTLAEVRLAVGEVPEAEKLLRRAGRLAERPGAAPTMRAAVSARRGVLSLALGRYADAEPALENALEQAEDLVGPEHPALVRLAQTLADCYRLRNRLSDAAELYARALRIAETAYGGSHPVVLPLLAGLAEVSERQGLEARAQAIHTRALAVADEVLADNEPVRLHYLCQLAAFHARRRDTDRAEVLFRTALDTNDSRRDPTLHRIALEGLRDVYVRAGRRAEAARVARELRSYTPPSRREVSMSTSPGSSEPSSLVSAFSHASVAPGEP